jgi:hypothetical protein
MWQAILIISWKWLSYVAARLIYGPISRAYRFIFEHKYKTMPIDIPWLTKRVLIFFKECTWKQDACGGVLDVISKPERFYETKTGDCDEYAAFASKVLPWHSFILSVTWFDPEAKWFKKFKGHNVCIYFYKRNWWYISNGGLFGPFKRPRDAWNSIAPEGTIPCSYSIRKDNLHWFAGGIIKKKK